MKGFDLWNGLLEYARWSPSPHNTQPWKVKLISATDADLFYDPSRLLPDEDPDGMFMTVGMGVFVEMLSIAARGEGYDIDFQYSGARLDKKETKPTFFGHLRLEKNKKREVLDRELIKQRRTSRLAYNSQPIGNTIIQELQVIAKDFGETFTFSSDPRIVDWIVRLNKDTMFYDMADQKTREEVGGWIRYSLKEASQKKDGLWAYCMNVASSVMYLFFNARWIVNLPGVYQIAGKIYLGTMKGTKTVAWLQGPFTVPDDWVRAGRMLARLWLTMTKYGIGLHPFGSIITNRKSHARLREKFKADESKNMMWLIMRLGYSDTPPRSFRLPLSEILLP
jgi:hypothetical protein